MFAVSLLMVGCDHPLVVETAPRPRVEAQADPPPAVATTTPPADLVRARIALDALVATWRSPAASTLHAQAARARSEAGVLAVSLSKPAYHSQPRLPQLMAEAAQADAAHAASSPRP